MTMADLFGLLDYHYWARDRMMAAAATLSPEQFSRDMGSSFRSVRDTLVHIYGAEWVWHARWRGASPSAFPAAGPLADLPGLRTAWMALEFQVREALHGLGADGAARAVDYLSLGGTPARSTYAEMVQHLVNHGSYHRGQLTTMLRQLGASPADGMDMILFFRERG